MASEEKLPWGLKSKGLTPGSMKTISENKLKAFNIGSMNIKQGVSKKEQEESKKKRHEEEAAEVYKEFVESFEDAERGINKSWVKGGVVNPEKGDEFSADKAANKLYKPSSKLLDKKVPLPAPTAIRQKEEEKPDRPNKPTPTPQRLWTPTPIEVPPKKKVSSEKRKTNLELFKEELKVIQSERQERRKIKDELGIEDPSRKSRFEPPEQVATGISLGIKPTAAAEDYRSGSYTYENDTQTTNIYLGNISPKMTEIQLCEIFGKYGPLASVKVMWPRSEEEKARGRNCGFVAYMNRKDGERAMTAIQGKVIMDFEMKLGWGKAVPIPPHPVYIPPALSELTLPPPPSGLPFNAQPAKSKMNSDKAYGTVPPPGGTDSSQPDQDPLAGESMEKILANAVVKVVIPTERPLLNTIHRMVEFVVREGPMFEAMIMNRELQNPMFRFLFENQSPAHVYYRWKLFSILQGDSPYRWRTETFHMFEGGSIWRPPQMNPFSQGMPEELIEDGSSTKSIPSLLEDLPKKGSLTDSQRDRLEDMLRNLTPERTKIGDAMVWCLEHADRAEEVVECIAESMSILQTPIPKKIARLFLISDILHNCSARVPHASFYRKLFEAKLPDIFKDIHDAYDQIDARLKAEQFKHKVMLCFRAWEDWAIYASDYLISLQNIFLGLVPLKGQTASPSEAKEEEDIDGVALEDVDGVPLEDLDGEPIESTNDIPMKSIVPYGDDIDGEPLDKNSSSADKGSMNDMKSVPMFAASKWETVDESELAAQAITLSKWDLLEQQRKAEEAARKAEEDIDGRPLSDDEDDGSQSSKLDSDWQQSRDTTSVDDESQDDSKLTVQQRLELNEAKRAKLREIELKVMRYQDELEAGKRSHKPEMSIAEQVEHYRKKQLRKASFLSTDGGSSKDGQSNLNINEEEKERDKEKEKRREEERERVKEWEQARDRDRDRSRKVYERNDRSYREDDANEIEDRRRIERHVERGDESDRSRHRNTEQRITSDRSRDPERSERLRETDRRRDRDRSRGGSDKGGGYYDDRERSYGTSDVEIIQSGNASPLSVDSDSESSEYAGQSSLVNYPSSPPSSYRDASDSRRKRAQISPTRLSRTDSPRKSQRSRSRSRSRHRHKKSRHS